MKTVLAAAGIAGLLVSTAAAQDMPTAHFKTVGPNNGSSNYEDIHKPFWLEHMPEATNGKVTADSASMSEVGITGPEFFRMVKLGVIDFATVPIGYASGELPEVEAVDIAGVAQSTEEMRQIIEAGRPRLEAMYRERAQVEPLAFWPTGGQIIWCATPLESLADMKGKKVRVYSATMSDMIEAIGAVPVTMAFAEVVPGMQRSVIDCAVTGANTGNLAKWTDVATHVVPFVVGWSVMAIVANQERWDGLDPAVQEAVRSEATSFAEQRGWRIAEDATQHGIWCSVGDERCDPSMGGPRGFNKTDLELVELTDEEKQERLQLIEEIVLPRFAERCGEACTQHFNETVGPILHIEAPQAG